ncbi:hypothetical protein BGZ52_001827 [Haplosporangium bisporale]|nr:hypothetical protein BGZ52_001827 [Haplosporangium bisporale]
MTIILAKKRKHELKEIALSLGLSDDGVREDLVTRIRHHVTTHGTSDPDLHELLREDGQHSTESNRLASLSSAAEDDLSDSAAKVRVTRSSPRKKIATSRTSARTASDSESAEDPLSEHQVQNFMEHVHEDLEGAKDLAHLFEHTLQQKYRSGKETLRRASKDFTSSVTEAIDGVVGAVSGSGDGEGHHLRHRHDRGHHRHRGENSWCGTILSELKYQLGCNTGADHCGLSACWADAWKKIHDLGSTSSGFVWITFLLELVVFLSSAFSQYSFPSHEGWFSCLRLFTDWKAFLTPFFAFYGALFLIPTLLSQLFNVDRSHRHHSRNEGPGGVLTGLLSRKTTSGLSYFVFKFALTYLFNQAVSYPNRGGLADLAKEAAEAVVGHHAHHHLWQDCEHLAEVFRYVPASLSAATSGVGTILALAENVISRRR